MKKKIEYFHPTSYLIAAILIFVITGGGLTWMTLFNDFTLGQLMVVTPLTFVYCWIGGKMVGLLLRKGSIVALRELCLQCDNCRNVFEDHTILIKEMCKVNSVPEINENKMIMSCPKFKPLKGEINEAG